LELPSADLDFSLPALDADIELPSADLELPSADFGITLPRTEGEFDISLPALDADIDLPSADLELPSADLDFSLPALDADIELPSADLELPSADLDISLPRFDADIELPSVDVELPSAELDISLPRFDADIELPSVDVELPSADFSIGARSAALDIDTDLGLTAGDAAIDTDLAALVASRLSAKPVIDPFGDRVIAGDIVVTGSGTPGSVIELLVERRQLGSAIVDPNGFWMSVLNLAQPGRYKLQARAIDASGKATMSDRIRLRTWAIDAVPQQDDLKRVWGIGPAIEKLLHANGITTFAQLAETSIETLDKILLQGGNRFRIAKHDNWARQARLAAEGKWEELSRKQENLDWSGDRRL
jgi:predicted flap endonuclease-1-like 5' DNA nuclease